MKPNFGVLFLGACLVASLGIGVVAYQQGQRTRPPPAEYARLPFDGARAFGYLERLCAFGPRKTGSEAMARQREFLVKHFQGQGATVAQQSFKYRDPESGVPVDVVNVIASWAPEKKERILFCAHYDTRPYPDQDKLNPRGVFLGANDGASGTALLMEMGAHMAAASGKYGVDFVLFDAEELIYDGDRDPFFVGSIHFAQQHAARTDGVRYRYGILFDMVGDKNLQIPWEMYSGVNWPDTVPIVREVWGTARRLGVREFIHRPGTEVRDDHLPLHDIGGISCIDIIDFDYPHWHTEADVPENCSGASLEKVGRVALAWLLGKQK